MVFVLKFVILRAFAWNTSRRRSVEPNDERRLEVARLCDIRGVESTTLLQNRGHVAVKIFRSFGMARGESGSFDSWKRQFNEHYFQLLLLPLRFI